LQCSPWNWPRLRAQPHRYRRLRCCHRCSSSTSRAQAARPSRSSRDPCRGSVSRDAFLCIPSSLDFQPLLCSGGGKCFMLERGAFDGMEACLMVHPGPRGNGAAAMTSTCRTGVTVTYSGRSAHAGVSFGALASLLLSSIARLYSTSAVCAPVVLYVTVDTNV